MQILGTFAIIAALTGFAVFFSTVNSVYGGSVAILIGLSTLLLLIATRHGRLTTAYRTEQPRQWPSPLGVLLNPTSRLWSLAAIFALLVVGILALRFMYWL